MKADFEDFSVDNLRRIFLSKKCYGKESVLFFDSVIMTMKL